MTRIDLSNYRKSGIKVFSGAGLGSDLRDTLKLDVKDNEAEKITIVIPKDTWDLTPSFFQGLFTKSITKLGKDKFYEKYEFEADDSIINTIKDKYVPNILAKNNALTIGRK